MQAILPICPRVFLLIFTTVRSRAGKGDMAWIGDEKVERVGRPSEKLTGAPITADFLRRR